MRRLDLVRFASQSVRASAVRSCLILAAMAFGIAGVVVLTWLGESSRLYIADQFRALGTNLVIVFPGRNETTGGAPPLLGETPRDLTLDDALALQRSPHVARVAPLIAGTAEIAFGGRKRETMVLGSTAELEPVRHLVVRLGEFLPPGDPRDAKAVCVIGSKVREELFGAVSPIGERVLIGDRRYRVIGVLQSEGMSLGTNLDEMVVVPVAAAQQLFDAPGLFRILVEARSRDHVLPAKEDCARMVAERHQGEEDVTVVTQESVLTTFDGILRAITLAVGGIAAISLVVAGILIMNVMVVAVTQRRAEIGLLKALGAPPREIRAVFLCEAALLAVLGAVVGAVLGELITYAVGALYPVLVPGAPAWALGAGVGMALAAGIGFGVAPARAAARQDPIAALSRR
jgi:putative ABC transport system permease protein